MSFKTPTKNVPPFTEIGERDEGRSIYRVIQGSI